MRLVDASSAESYLRESSCLAPGERVCIRELTGGVSNMVLLVERPDRPGSDFVLKQARAQLRTAHEWFSRVERVWRETDVLAVCGRLLERPPSGGNGKPSNRGELRCQTPRLLFEDRPNYLFAMSAAPRPHAVWKGELLAGRLNPAVAVACGSVLGALHARSWHDAKLNEQLGDCSLFDELRVDPYYRALAERRDDARAGAERLIASLEAPGRSLVLADFSPKNLLLHSQGLVLVDFETGHFGDPAFDLGFFLSHLVLKAALHAPQHAAYLDLTEHFRRSYDAAIAEAVNAAERDDLWARGVQHFAGCVWARLDGKSPVEYLSDETRREAVRSIAREVFRNEPRAWPAVLDLAAGRLAEFS